MCWGCEALALVIKMYVCMYIHCCGAARKEPSKQFASDLREGQVVWKEEKLGAGWSCLLQEAPAKS